MFNEDLADFFDYINFGRVRGFFIKDRTFNLEAGVATILAQIACTQNALPQGSPCSPIISNLVANILDVRLLGLAKQSKCSYTSYADDLTFSTNESAFPDVIGSEVSPSGWVAGNHLVKTIDEAGFKLNPTKTRMSLRNSRQMVTGLVINQKLNISQNYYRGVRAMCDSLFRTGHWYKPSLDANTPPVMVSDTKPLEGMLAHIYFVKSRKDRTHKANKAAAFVAPKAPIEQYRKLIFYKYFAAPSAPMLVTEGVTDIVYLKCAIRSRASLFPMLVSLKNGRHEYVVRFLNATDTVRSVLNLGNGAADQASLIGQYESRLRQYNRISLAYPVIIISDNDEGLKNIIGTVKTLKAGPILSRDTRDPFYYISNNLYVIKVPERVPGSNKDIEDLFPDSTLSERLNDKPFDKRKDHEDHTAYGKAEFASKVVRPKLRTIDFSGFDELLQRIVGCLDDYRTKIVAEARSQAVG